MKRVLNRTLAKIGDKIQLIDTVENHKNGVLIRNGLVEVVGFSVSENWDSEFLTVHCGEVFGGPEKIHEVEYVIKTYNAATGERGPDIAVPNFCVESVHFSKAEYLEFDGDSVSMRDFYKFVKKHRPSTDLVRKILKQSRRKAILERRKKQLEVRAEIKLRDSQVVSSEENLKLIK